MAEEEMTTQATQPVPEPEGAPPGQRLMIERMELTNFKSYANTVKIGPFDRNMTSVVGPNGSGKSNVIDAMLFVFGFKAKQMRQSKVSELIHSSEQYPDLQYAKVAVFFQYIIDKPDGSGYTVVEGSELVVTREARRDNSSTYRVNDKTKTFAEVGALLRTRGIDLDHNRFLILQGEVEQIAMMKPKAPSAHEDGLLEYLEDIIGSNRLVPAIEEALKGMEECNEQRATKLNALKASEQNVRGLEGRKAEAEMYLSTEAQLNWKKSAYYQKNASQAMAFAAQVVEKRDELKLRLDDEKGKNDQQKEAMAELEKAYKKGKKEHDKCNEQLDKSRKEFQKYEREDIRYREEKKADKAQHKKALSAIEKAAKELGASKHELAALQEDMPRLEKEAASLGKEQTAANAELEGMYENLKGQTEPLRVKIEEAQRKREPDAQVLTAAKSEEQISASEKTLLEKKAKDAEAEREKAQAELAGHDEATRKSRDDLKAAEGEHKKISAEIETAESVVAMASEKEASLAADERAARAKYDEGRANATDNSARSGQLKGLMAAKRDGSIPGIVGRLGSLGSIGAEYDVAASTACGALDNIVVADTASAQACVSLLREKSLGVATFLILDKQVAQWGGKMKAPFEAPAGSQRLYDLLTVTDEAHRAAFYSAFRDTLVTDDKAKANKIAFNGKVRHRVVTTDGVVINTSGTMEGGGKPLKGRMGPSAAESAGGGLSDKELAKQLEKANAITAELEQFKAARGQAQVALRDLKKNLGKVATNKTRLAMQIEAADGKKKDLQARVARSAGLGALSDDETKRLKELDAELKKHAAKVASAQAKVDKSDEDLAALQEQVLAVGGVRLRAQKAKVEGLGERLSGVEGQLGKAQAQAEGSEKSVKKLEAALAKAKETAETLEKKIEGSEALFKKLEDDALVVMEKYKEAEATLATKAEELAEQTAAYEAKKKEVSKVRTVESEMEHQLEELSRQVKDNEHKAKHWSAKLSELREKLARAADEAKADEEAMAQQSAEDGMEVDQEASGEAADGEAGGSSSAAGASAGDGELSPDELDALDRAELESEIAQLEEKLNSMDGNLSAIAEYRQREREYKARLREFDAITAARDAKRKDYEGLRKQRLDEFMGGFKIIGMKLKEMYQMITLGGDAELELLDSLDPFSEGICFSVRPPKKSWKHIANLSGGEKTLSSLALVFALHHYKPTPLYVMDEIDAALDFRNVSIVGNYIKERTRNAQFIIISLRNNMFELADRLVGIYKTNNATKSVAINPAAFTISAR